MAASPSTQQVQRQEDKAHPAPTHSLSSSLTSALDTVIQPAKAIVTAPATRKTLVGSILLILLVAISIGTAICAYSVFYYLYIPHVGFTKDVWLQYG